MSQSQIETVLLKKISRKKLSDYEQSVLDNWLNVSEDNIKVLAELMDEKKLVSELKIIHNFNAEVIWDKVEKDIQLKKIPYEKSNKLRHFNTRWLYAAAAILFLFSVSLYLLKPHFNKHSNYHEIASAKTNLPPANNKAILTLSDGSTIILNDSVHGIISHQHGSTINIQNDGSVTYATSSQNLHTSKIFFNTITTPRGAQTHLVLPDQSQVWLNTASSITYPVAFAGNERRVKITGEVYFEVAHNKKQPFYVQTNECEIQVLGTHFNINSYDDEDNSKITLLEGHIQLTPNIPTSKNRLKISLIPGQQAIVSYHNHSINVATNADINKAIDWKNGLFDFNGMQLREVMRELSRWYDLDIEYENDVPNTRFVGEMSRNVPLSDVLKGFENMGIHCRIQAGRKLIVTK